MNEGREFSFGGESVSAAYDNVLVPLLFEPWGKMLLETLPPEPGWSVLDLATGTGIVAQKLAERLGSGGSVVGADLSPEMLAVAKQRCGKLSETVRFVESAADSLQLDDESVDAVYCQQGFQFFPDKTAAAGEMLRVLRGGGRVAVATWCPLSECVFFGVICDVLRRFGEEAIATMMAVPFDHLPAEELQGHFTSAGFEDVEVSRREKEMVFTDGAEQVFEAIYATPIGPKLRELGDEKQAELREAFLSELGAFTTDGVTRGKMTSLVLTGKKA